MMKNKPILFSRFYNLQSLTYILSDIHDFKVEIQLGIESRNSFNIILNLFVFCLTNYTLLKKLRLNKIKGENKIYAILLYQFCTFI